MESNPVNALVLRPAYPSDIPALETLIAASARALSVGYGSAQIEAALEGAFGVDRELIEDGTYFVADTADELVACGGWSRRRKLFGSSCLHESVSALLDPSVDAARVRAFFVRPDWARRGLGRALLTRCEEGARRHGFRRMELVATLAGKLLYEACGYVAQEPVSHTLPDGSSIAFVAMRKNLLDD